MGSLGISADVADLVTLCVREAVINALKHGCQGDPLLQASLAVDLLPHSRIVRAAVSDPGKGYTPKPNRPPHGVDIPPDPEGHISLGLEVIRSMASDVRFFRKGATIEMDFQCPA